MTDIAGGLPGTLTPVAYIPTSTMTFDEFGDKLLLLKGLEGSVMWWLGDLLNFASARWGEKYTQALEATDYEYTTLARASYMAARFPPERRRVGLSFSHHREIADLPPDVADAWLVTAEEEGLSVRGLKLARKKAVTKELAAGLDEKAVERALNRLFKDVGDKARECFERAGGTGQSEEIVVEHELPNAKTLTVLTRVRVD
tara:strand:+ start:1192 stop:1794 length:603 start_codon:yes stop_codon:yes gene_type:complete